ncbi:MAG: PAS domain S-box protein [Pseudomonadota bacterium]
MMDPKKDTPGDSRLRQRAEKKIDTDGAKTEFFTEMSPENMLNQLYEFQVHQVELKMQNDELRRMHEELEQSRNKYSQLYDFAPNGYCTVNEKGIIDEANLTLASMLGVTRKALIGKPFSRFVFKEDQDIYHLHRKKKIKTGVPKMCDLRMAKNDGTVFFGHLLETAVQPDDSSFVFHFMLSDITERKEMENVLQRNEAHLRTLIDTIPDLVWLKDSDGVFISCNKRFEHLYNAREKDIIGRSDYDFVDKELANFFRKNDKSAMVKGKSITNEEDLVFANDGHMEICETIKTPMYNSDGNLIGVLGIARDITHHKQFEKELKQKTSELEEINIALKVLLKNREQDKNNIEEKIFANYQLLLTPIIQNLKTTLAQENQKDIVNILESELKNILSSFSKKLSDKMINLTPTEIHVAGLIKSGKTNKEIAEILNSSVHTISRHRDNIRVKTGLKNNKINLRSFLLSLT